MWHILIHVAILFINPTRADYNSNRRDGLYSPTPIDDYRNGSFLSPRSPATIYPPGSKMMITWNTTSFSLKLILYQRNSTGADSSSSYIPDPQAQDEGRYVWTVDRTWDDYSSPYVMRGLDAGADEGYQTNDFWTPMFYIGDTEWGSSTRALPSSSTSSRVSTRSESIGLWGFSTATPTATPTATSRTFTTPTTKPTPADSSSQGIYDPDSARWVSNPGDWPESAALGLLMGITLAIVGIILCLVTMFFNRLQRKEAEKLKLVPVNTSNDEVVSGGYTRVPAASPVEMEVGMAEMEIGPVEMEGTRVWVEMGARREVPRVEDLDELAV